MTTAERSDALFRTLIATAADGIIVIDIKGSIQVYNAACERLFAYQSEASCVQTKPPTGEYQCRSP